jgi:hypothetical protein
MAVDFRCADMSSVGKGIICLSLGVVAGIPPVVSLTTILVPQRLSSLITIFASGVPFFEPQW